nr:MULTISPECIES: S-layer homology domain-containing protein [unclassified Paenibacillus]
MKKKPTKHAFGLMISFSLMIGTVDPGHVKAEPIQDVESQTASHDQKENKTLSRGKAVQELKMNHHVASMTEKRTFQVKFTLPQNVDSKSISWTYGGKPLSEWKKFAQRDYTGPSFITVSDGKAKDGQYTANITFDLPYDTDNLAEPRLQRPLYASLMGTYELAATAHGQVIAQTPVKLTPYDSFHTYDELKTDIDAVTAQAAKKNDRYIKTISIGKSVEGRDIYLTILAKDKASVDQYQNVTHPAMMNNPKQLQADIQSGTFGDYKVPIWLNNIHPNEAPGVDSIFNFFKSMALDDSISYDTKGSNGQKSKINLNMDQALNQVIFLFVYTDNPDGRVHTTRANPNYFDLNRDNSYQTQPETRSVTEQIAKWSPLSFLDLHGFDSNFLIEPTTPPHDPNIEYDLLIDSMLEQAKAMGEAGIANTKYNDYYIPYEEHQKSVKDPNYVPKGISTGWDDATPAYTAVFAMHHGALGQTLEVPESNEESTKALYYSVAGATHYVMENKEKLFMNQLKIYERGIDNKDDRAVDPYLVNAKDEIIGRPRSGNQNFFPEYYVLPIDRSIQKNAYETYRMIEYFLRNGIKVERSIKPVTVSGTTYPAGSFVIDMHQSYHGYANSVLYDGIDVSDYESVAGEIVQDFPVLRGFNRYVIREPRVFEGKTAPVISVTIPATAMPDKPSVYVLLRNTNNDAIKAVNELLASGKHVTMLTKTESEHEAGDFVVSYDDLNPLASKYLLDVSPFSDHMPVGKELKSALVGALGEPAYVLENLGFKVTSDQAQADVLVNTFDSSEQVGKGKPYIAYGNMGMVNVQDWIPGFSFGGPEWKRYEGVFLADVKQDSVITAPYDKQEYFYTITGSYIKTVPKTANILATISSNDDFYKAGWWPGHEAAKGQIMAFTYKENNKNVTVFSNDLTNGAHSQHQFRLLANSIFNAVSNRNQSSESAVGFSDLQSVESWAGSEIHELARLGLVNGFNGGRFEPLKQVTRVEFLAMIVRAFNLYDQKENISFKDVPPASWYETYVKAAVGLKLAEGTGEGYFEPNRAITREEMAKISANAMKITSGATAGNIEEALAKFGDRETIAPYAREAAALLTQKGIIQGLPGSTFGPKAVATRAEAAVIISRIKQIEG